MVLFNYATRELTAKIVYYGPGLCGKTTNLQYVHQNLPDSVKGKMLSLATKTDRTLFFDFLPIDLGSIRGMKTRVQLYTVPGQVFYNETRKLVLKGADGIVFVADSQEPMMGANTESFRNLEENLKGHGMTLAEMPHVIQFNKRDLPKLSSIEQMNGGINRYNAPFYESVATTGIGVQDTLKAITKLVLLHLTKKYDPQTAVGAEPPSAASPSPAPPAEAPATPVAAAEPPRGPASAPVFPAPTQPSDHVRPPEAASGAIPLSEVEDPFSTESKQPGDLPPPPDFGVGSEAEDEPVPAFAEQEIDDLVGEVEESGPSAAVPAEGTFPEPAAAPMAAAPAGEAEEQPSSGDTFPSLEELESVSAPLEGPAPAAASGEDAKPGPASEQREPAFEVDRDFDPDWQDKSPGTRDETRIIEPAEQTLPIGAAPGLSGPAESGPPAAAPGPELPDGTRIPVQHMEEGAGEPDDAAVVLTEIASDEDLFEDPHLQVARLASGQAQEIVVPVELREGEAIRKFKLSVTLRLDPVD